MKNVYFLKNLKMDDICFCNKDRKTNPVKTLTMASTSAAAAESFAERMRKKTCEVRGEYKTYKDFKDAADITTFFEDVVKKDAMSKIEKRAARGHFTANILEYGFKEYFYVSSGGDVVRVPKFERIPGVYMHGIYNIVHSSAFQKMLKDFMSELGDMRASCWYPNMGDLVNVITVSWGLPQNEGEDESQDKDQEETSAKDTDEASTEDIKVKPKKTARNKK